MITLKIASTSLPEVISVPDALILARIFAFLLFDGFFISIDL